MWINAFLTPDQDEKPKDENTEKQLKELQQNIADVVPLLDLGMR